MTQGSKSFYKTGGGVKYDNVIFQCSLELLIILARFPDDPQRIRVASVFEFSDCSLSVCLFSVGKFSNLF